MMAEHSLEISCRCPVDEAILDVYQVVVRTNHIIKVEDILSAVAVATQQAAFQEAITETIARNLRAKVLTLGKHSGVSTLCICS